MENFMLKVAKFKSPLLVFLHDTFMVPIAWLLAYWVRIGFKAIPNETFASSIHLVLPLLFASQIFFYWYFGLYRGIWRFASLPDLGRVIKAVAASCFVTEAIIILFTRIHGIPRSIIPLYGILLICLLSGSRLLYRSYKERHDLKQNNKEVLIIGAGNAGEVLVRDLLRSSNHDYKPIGFIDDSTGKQGKEIHGIRVLGKIDDIKDIAQRKDVKFAIIAIPSASAKQMCQIVENCHAAGISFKTLPSLSEMASGEFDINSLREVAVEDLLGREEVEINIEEVRNAIIGKTILISGGGGSIGSEICRQLARLRPKALAIIDNSEFNTYQIDSEIRKKFPYLEFHAYLGSVCDEILLRKIFQEIKPELVFHAAAYKHVPLLENRAYTAVYNNVWGTKVFSDLAGEAGVEKFVLISTDKAVKPVNVMGATKRLAEMICLNKNSESKTKFLTVRFGNVLGSSGSVVPLFKQQLANGGPITVTHPEITRYFMTIPEAVRLILQACALGNEGELFVLDMGEPVKIGYLAEQIIRLSGKEVGSDIKIVYTGLRPGEKLHEKLFYEDEQTTLTRHKKIFKVLPSRNKDNFELDLRDMIGMLKDGDEKRIYGLLKKIIVVNL